MTSFRNITGASCRVQKILVQSKAFEQSASPCDADLFSVSLVKFPSACPEGLGGPYAPAVIDSVSMANRI
jgi:hypothetical protein